MSNRIVESFVAGFREIYSDMEEWNKKQLASYASSLLVHISETQRRDECVRMLYWTIPEIPENLICAAFQIEWGDLQTIVSPSLSEVSCSTCSNAIPMFMKDRDDRDRLWRIAYRCEPCVDRLYAENAQKMAEEGRERHRLEHEGRVAELRAMSYTDYLLTPDWQTKRIPVLERDNHACRLCGSKDQLNVHHRSYQNLGDEPMDDLTTLCWSCHNNFHATGSLSRPN